MTAPIMALALATGPPDSNSQSTMKALRTRTMPSDRLPEMHDGMFVVVAAAAVRPVLVMA